MTLVDVSQLIDSSQLQDVHKVKEPKLCAYEKLLQSLHSVGSPLWGDLSTCDVGGSSPEMDIMLPRFIFVFFSLNLKDPGFVRRIERLSDTVVQLESFADSKKARNPLYKDYHGLLNIKQLPKLNSIKCQMPDVMDWAFKLKRKKLVIEKLHLPPDLSVSASRPEDHPATSYRRTLKVKENNLGHFLNAFTKFESLYINSEIDWDSTIGQFNDLLFCFYFYCLFSQSLYFV
ncbi:ELP4 [Acanthosepion pharaonis]|uniref:Elongator complex protein 4 n=1 Tax=Acanthosepion pharaonis TaxID=158019 RepID=A0A812CN31_ACAPH|nr:ELP4 [Sepia pharaonis]